MIIYFLITAPIEGFTCKHCDAYIPSLDTAPTHECFENKNVYMDNNNVLFADDSDINHERKRI